jgi:hypothetical protein
MTHVWVGLVWDELLRYAFVLATPGTQALVALVVTILAGLVVVTASRMRPGTASVRGSQLWPTALDHVSVGKARG